MHVIYSGEAALNQVINKARFCEPPQLSQNLFLNWISNINDRKLAGDSEYQLQIKLRELKRVHIDKIKKNESDSKEAENMFKLNPNFMLLSKLERDIVGGKCAITNMEKLISSKKVDTNIAALNAAERIVEEKFQEKYNKVVELLPNKIIEVTSNIQLFEKLKNQTAEFALYNQALDRQAAFLREIGVDDMLKSINSDLKSSGVGRNKRGKSFESVAFDVLTENLLPKLALKYNVDVSSLFIVRNMTLSMASSSGSNAELDCVVCLRDKGARPERLRDIKPSNAIFTRVLAVVEVKRNPDDMGEAFLKYQRCLTWLCGIEDAYDPQLWKNRHYSRGHFHDKPYVYFHNKESLIFCPESFALFAERKQVTEPPSSATDAEKLLTKLKTALIKTQSDLAVGEAAQDNADQVEEDSEGGNETVVEEEEEAREESVASTLIASGRDAENATSIAITAAVEELDTVGAAVGDSSASHVFLDNLFFVARDGPVDCISSKPMMWALRKVSEEVYFTLDLAQCPDQVERLRAKVESRFPHRFSTVDLVNLYKLYGCLDQLLLVNEPDKAESNI